jgi:hypothetical protein
MLPTLLSQHKLALTARNTVHLLHNKIIGAPKQFKNGPVHYLGIELTIHVIKSIP